MTDKEYNQRVSKLFKRFIDNRRKNLALHEKHGQAASGMYDYEAIEDLKKDLASCVSVVGGIEGLTKLNILKLIKMQSSLRFMAEHRFYMEFARACDDLTGEKG